MTEKPLSKQELVALFHEAMREILSAVVAEAGTAPRETDENTEPTEVKRQRGRPRSPYKGQLHLLVLPEDRDWFKSMALGRDITNGKMFGLLRSCFEQNEANGVLELETSDLKQRKVRND
ncbi:hypothetical protein [Tateyamaria sp. Alg231-49]|uniref:hypothetical protein n=1 Tax=Tateyamaria sp. Alg231-49 TaxID=1922219 RepID=UPI000D555E04|nr:hypothetical protein [Tateyamaria sp. Alg231-49]